MRVTGMTRKLSLAVLATSAVVCSALAAPAASMASSAPVFEQQLPVTGITRTTATVWAQLNPGESETAYEVRFGVDEILGQHTPQYNAGSGSTAVTVNAGLLGLTPGTTYYYEFVATNSEGTTVGPLETFTTAQPTPPTATTGGASEVTLTTATVSGTIAARGLPTSYELDLGTDATYGTSMYGEVGSGSEPVAIALSLTGLEPGTTFHYRIDAINSDGRSYGADETFTTPVYDKPIVLPPTAPLLATPPIAFPAEAPKASKSSPRKKAKHKNKHKNKHHGNRKHRRTRHKKKR